VNKHECVNGQEATFEDDAEHGGLRVDFPFFFARSEGRSQGLVPVGYIEREALLNP
jgi:hypothetical protein